MKTQDLVGKIDELAKVVRESSDKAYYRDNERALKLRGEHLFSEGHERVSYPGNAEVVNYHLFSDGVLKMDIHLGEEDFECYMKSTEIIQTPEFVKRVKELKETKNLEASIKEITEKYQTR